MVLMLVVIYLKNYYSLILVLLIVIVDLLMLDIVVFSFYLLFVLLYNYYLILLKMKYNDLVTLVFHNFVFPVFLFFFIYLHSYLDFICGCWIVKKKGRKEKKQKITKLLENMNWHLLIFHASQENLQI